MLSKVLPEVLRDRSQGVHPKTWSDIESYSMALGFVKAALSSLPPETAALIESEIEEYAARNAGRAFVDVNETRALSQRYIDAHAYFDRFFLNTNARHLELGTFKTFPDDVVAAIKQARGLSEFIRLDLSNEFGPELVADCAELPLEDGSVDVVSSNSVFEHIAYPHDTIRETYRVLSPGGAMIVTVPFLFTMHGCPRDYMRYTPHFFEDICRAIGFDRIECFTEEYGGGYYSMHLCSKSLVVRQDPNPAVAKAMSVLHHNIMTLLMLLSPLDRFFENGGTSLFTSVKCIAYKPGGFQPRQPSSATGTFDERNIDMLRCPETGQGLRVVGQTLVSIDGSRKYDVRGNSAMLVRPKQVPGFSM